MSQNCRSSQNELEAYLLESYLLKLARKYYEFAEAAEEPDIRVKFWTFGRLLSEEAGVIRARNE